MLTRRLVGWLAVSRRAGTTSGSELLLPQRWLCHHWCWVPHGLPRHDQSTTVFNRGPRKRLWGLTRVRVGESPHGPQPSTQQSMWLSEPYSSNPWYQICCLSPHSSPPLPDPWRAYWPVPCPALHCRLLSCCQPPGELCSCPALFPTVSAPNAGQGQHSRQGAGRSLGLESPVNRLLSKTVSLSRMWCSTCDLSLREAEAG